MAMRFFLLLAIAVAALSPSASTDAVRGKPRLHDGHYVSPTWGYEVRWYEDEWSLDEATSEAKTDHLALVDDAGTTVAFLGTPDFAGDAARCLDANVARLEADPRASDIAVVRNELDEPQVQRDPRRSWTLNLARFDVDGEAIDIVVSIDCLSLVPGQAVLVRTVLGPAATFESTFDRLDVLNAALPRSAAPADAEDWGLGSGSPLLADPAWSFKGIVGGAPRPLLGADGTERMAIHLVDFDDRTRVYRIENSSLAPLTIDPARFMLTSPPETTANQQGSIGPSRTVWEESGETGPRALLPGERATLLLEFPDELARLAATNEYWRLIYLDAAFQGGYAQLECFDCAGGFSRPKLRISR